MAYIDEICCPYCLRPIRSGDFIASEAGTISHEKCYKEAIQNKVEVGYDILEAEVIE